jgi:hypothetical protein
VVTGTVRAEGLSFGVGAALGAAAVMALALRPVIFASHPPTFGPATRGDGAAALRTASRGKAGADSGEGPVDADAALLSSFTTNLWAGDRLDEVTVKRAPLFEHRNSTSLNSTVSG